MDSDDNSSYQSEEEQTIASPDVVTKYKTGAEIANRVLDAIIPQCVPGKAVIEICQFGDEQMNEQIALVYRRGGVEKGIAFPTCISKNDIVGNYSPYPNEEAAVLEEGDLVKIDLAVHIDGFISSVAHTIVLSGEGPITGRKADVILAAYNAAEAAIRTLRPGKSNYDVTEAIAKCAAAYRCAPVEGVLSHQTKQFVIDGNKTIIGLPSIEGHVSECTIEENEVYTLDIVMSTGDGHTRESDMRPTVFKRAVEQNYQLKMKSSRQLFHEISTNFPGLPFTMRMLEARAPRFGISEMLKHGLLHVYPVVTTREGEYVAQIKYTALVLPSQTMKITGAALPQNIQSEYAIQDPEIRALLATSLGRKKRKPKKKNKKAE
eukprot:gnl/Trimastix_PCT/148.p1 GENE.gnl/Trimastix_PCT/148~~gnl/Trimastix_PCT/148.p1  ORF type:complete len:376 (+),score=136.56 gnl/Trimastix_PCT/148:820-1947(+)